MLSCRLPGFSVITSLIRQRPTYYAGQKILAVIICQFKKKTECVVKTHDRSETFVLQGNIVIIHQSLLNSIFTTKLYILMKTINYKQR
jgi:hypothetical protein